MHTKKLDVGCKQNLFPYHNTSEMFTKWLLKNGFGSPGKTAKVYCDRYKYFQSKCHGDADAIFKGIFEEREIVSSQGVGFGEARYSFTSAENLIALVKHDFPYFIFIMCFLETKNFRNGAYQNEKVCDLTVEVIYDTVQKECPNSSLKSLDLVQDLAKAYTRNFYKILNY